MKGVQAVHGLLLVLLLSLPFFFADLAPWPFYLVVPLALYAVIVLATPPLRRSVTWLRPGRPDAVTWALTLATVVLAPAALVLWYRHFRADADLSNLGDQMPKWDLPALLLAGVGFSIANAFLEEVVFRGVLYEALAESYGATVAVVVQGIVFGIVHAHGFPRGIVGIALASLFGVVLGYLRRRSGGLLAPFLPHVVADATIFGILLVHVNVL